MNLSLTKKFMTVLTIAAVLLTAFAGCGKKVETDSETASKISSAQQESSSSEVTEGMIGYGSNTSDFSFEYPQDWMILEGDSVELTPPEAKESKITIHTGTIGKASIDSYREKQSQFEEQAKAQSPNASDFNFSEYTSAGNPKCSAFVMSYKLSQYGVAVNVTSYMVIVDGTGGPSVIVSDANDGTDVATVGQHIVDTFGIKKS